MNSSCVRTITRLASPGLLALAENETWDSVTERSLLFEIMIVIGYCCGVAAKIIIFKRTGELQYSFWFYILDIALVSTDICLYFRNLRIDKKMGRI